MILALLLLSASPARAEQNTDSTYKAFRSGVPAGGDETAVREGLARLELARARVAQFARVAQPIEDCRTVQSLVDRAVEQFAAAVAGTIRETEPDIKLLNRVRARIAMGAVGYLVSRACSPECPVFGDIVRSVADIRDVALGQPGFDEEGRDEDDLLRLAAHEEVRAGRRKLGVNLIALGASMVFWELFPPVALAGISGTLPIAATALTNPWLMTPLRGAGVLADAATYVYSEKLLAADPLRAQRNVTGGWTENRLAIERFLASPIDSPELYFGYVNQSRASLAAGARAWLNAHHRELGLGEGWIALVNEATEAQIAPGAPLRLKIEDVRQRLAETYGAEAQCEQDWIMGTRTAECLLGLRHLLLAFQRGLIPALSPLTRHVLSFKMGEDAGQTQTEDTLGVRLAASAAPIEMAATINTLLASGTLATRLEGRRQFLRASLRLADQLGHAPEFDEDLTAAERARACDRVADILSAHPDYRSNRAGIFVIGRRYRPIFELRLGAAEGIAIETSDARLEDGLAQPRPAPELARINLARERILELTASLLDTGGLRARCSVAASLSLADCESGLRRLRDYLRANPQLRLPQGGVTLVSLNEANQSVDLGGPEGDTLVLRPDFFPGQIRPFVTPP